MFDVRTSTRVYQPCWALLFCGWGKGCWRSSRSTHNLGVKGRRSNEEGASNPAAIAPEKKRFHFQRLCRDTCHWSEDLYLLLNPKWVPMNSNLLLCKHNMAKKKQCYDNANSVSVSNNVIITRFGSLKLLQTSLLLRNSHQNKLKPNAWSSVENKHDKYRAQVHFWGNSWCHGDQGRAAASTGASQRQ